MPSDRQPPASGVTHVTRQPRAGAVFRRALRGRCPRCGVGFVFLRGLRNERTCSNCDWRLERGPGHWVGGSEVHMLVAFPSGLVLTGATVLAFGFVPAALAAGLAASLAFSLATYRTSRCVFFAIDYLLDPVPDPSSGIMPGFGGGGNAPRDPRCDRHGPRRPAGGLRAPGPVPAPGPVSASGPVPAPGPIRAPASPAR
jgi:uncharacterized protein (DUF983 family)